MRFGAQVIQIHHFQLLSENTSAGHFELSTAWNYVKKSRN